MPSLWVKSYFGSFCYIYPLKASAHYSWKMYRPSFHCQPSVLSNIFLSSSPSIFQVAHSLQPPPPPCSRRPFRRPRLPLTTPPLVRPPPSGNARFLCWRKTPPTLTWSPTEMTRTCYGLSPPPRVSVCSFQLHFYLFIRLVFVFISYPNPGPYLIP